MYDDNISSQEAAVVKNSVLFLRINFEIFVRLYFFAEYEYYSFVFECE